MFRFFDGNLLTTPLQVLLIISGLCLAGATSVAQADIVVTFGTYAADKPTVTVRKFKPLLHALEAALSERLGESVRIRTEIATTYARGIEDLVSGRVDFARFGPASYVTAKQANNGISLIAMEAVNGEKAFNGVIAVRSDSTVQSPAELTGKSFAFGSKLSTIGRYLSQTELLDHGMRASDLERFDYLGRHDRVGMAVAHREYDAGALKESTFNKLVQKNIPLRTIAVFPNVTKPWIARAGLPPKLLYALQDALLTLQDKTALAAIKKSGFLKASDADYEPIRHAIDQSRQFGD